MSDPKENSLLKSAKGIFPYVATPAMLVYIIWTTATFKEQVKGVTFSDNNKKVKTEMHVDNGPSAADEREAFILDSINKSSAIKSRAKRDSIFQILLDEKKVTDSLKKLDSDQIYQIKEEFKGIKEELKKIQIH